MAQAIQFVVQRHEASGGVHWDLMVEQADALATWQLPVAPEQIAGVPIAIERIADHEKRFLTYEGPLRSHIGSVEIHDRGTCVVLSQSTDRWLIRFGGRYLAGTYRVEYAAGAESTAWQITKVPG